MSKLEQSIYHNYRNALKSFRANSHGSSERASERKQRALKVTSERYGVPLGEIKNIVRVHEIESGITHEHPANYKLLLDVDEKCHDLYEDFTHPIQRCTTCFTEQDGQAIRYRIDQKDWRELTVQDITITRSCLRCHLERRSSQS